MTKIRTGDVVRTLSRLYTRKGGLICEAGAEASVTTLSWRGLGDWHRLTPVACVEVRTTDGSVWWPMVNVNALEFVRRPRRAAR